MRKGTTPKHTFTIPFDTSLVKKFRVVYSQRHITKIKKSEGEMVGNTISVRLTQEETFCLDCGYKTDIQLRILTNEDESFVSDIITVETERCLDNEVL